MTSYVNNTNLVTRADILKPVNWLAGEVLKLAGKFPVEDIKDNKGVFLQLNDRYMTDAAVEVSDNGEFPESPKAKDVSILRKPKYFNEQISYDHKTWLNYQENLPMMMRDYQVKVDGIKYKHIKTVEQWFVGYSTTFASLPNVDTTWQPWFNARPLSGSSSSDPADINHLVTNIAGTTGTEGTLLDMGTTLYSTSINATVDFVTNTIQPIKSIFEDFKDSNSGLRMAETNSSYTMLTNPLTISWLNVVHPFDGEKFDMGTTIAAQLRAMNINLTPSDDFTASATEDGTMQFALIPNFERNFQIGILKDMTPTGWKESGGLNPTHQEGFESRYVPYTQPYTDGSGNFRKAFFHGSFTFKNDSP